MRGGTAPLGPGYTKPTLGTVGCCPYAKNGKPITTLTTNVMNPRRLIAAPRGYDRASYQFAIELWKGFGFGSKSRHVQCKTACPLYPRKQTCAVQLGTGNL